MHRSFGNNRASYRPRREKNREKSPNIPLIEEKKVSKHSSQRVKNHRSMINPNGAPSHLHPHTTSRQQSRKTEIMRDLELSKNGVSSCKATSPNNKHVKFELSKGSFHKSGNHRRDQLLHVDIDYEK